MKRILGLPFALDNDRPAMRLLTFPNRHLFDTPCHGDASRRLWATRLLHMAWAAGGAWVLAHATAAGAQTPSPPAPPPARWVAQSFEALPAWSQDDFAGLWHSWLNSCRKPLTDWKSVCEEALALKPEAGPNDPAAMRAWLQERFHVYQLQDSTGRTEGLLTGYYEPEVEARTQAAPLEGYTTALHAAPLSGPMYTRRQYDTLPAAKLSLEGRELAWVREPLDALVLQIQGSGRLWLRDSATDPGRWVRLAYAGHNGQPYGSIGKWLISKGLIAASDASWPGIAQWFHANPGRQQELLWQNPRVVFFKLAPLEDAQTGALGAQGVPLTPGRSVAIDPSHIPYGTLLWMHSDGPGTRLVVAQDTGSAIRGAIRADYFWGWGDEAGQQAGRTRHKLQLWALWPKGQRPPGVRMMEGYSPKAPEQSLKP